MYLTDITMVEIELITYTLTLFVQYLNVMPGAFV